MSVVDAFSAQFSAYATPTPPSWPSGTTAGPSDAVPVSGGAQPNAGYPIQIPAGNPDRLTVAQVVARAYRLDPQRDHDRIQRMADVVAQQNGLMLANWPIPPDVTAIALPWPPAGTANGGSSGSASGGAPSNSGNAPSNRPGAAKPPKRHRSTADTITQVIAGLGAVAAGVGRIAIRHNGRPGVLSTTGLPGQFTNPADPNANLAADIQDAVPVIADIGALATGNDLPAWQPGLPGYAPGYGPYPTTPGLPGAPDYPTAPSLPAAANYPTPPSLPATPNYPSATSLYSAPNYPTAPGFQAAPDYQNAPASLYNPYQQPGTYSYQAAGPAWANNAGNIAASIGALAQTIGGLFKHH